MGAGNKYWDADAQAVIAHGNVNTSWGRPGVSHSVTAVQLMNRAFEIFYIAKKNISNVTDADLKVQMLKELHDSATDGWGSGVSDLEESFDHLVANKGKWTDENSKNYYPSATKLFWTKESMLVESAEGPVNFLDSVDGKLKKFVSAVKDFQTNLDRLNRLKALEDEAPGKDWREINKVLKDMKDANNKMKKVLWFVSTTSEKVDVRWIKELGKAAPTGMAATGKISKGLSALSEFAEAAEFYEKCVGAGMPKDAAVAMVALRKALSYVPILGQLYAQMVTGIPQLMQWYKGLIDDYCRRIDRETKVF